MRPAYLGHLDSRLQSREALPVVSAQLKAAWLRNPSIRLTETQALDHPIMRELFQHDSFRELAWSEVLHQPSLVVQTRGKDPLAVLRYWLDLDNQRPEPTYLSGLSPEINSKIKRAHAARELNTFEQFRAIHPPDTTAYHDHIALFSSKAPNLEVKLSPDSYRGALVTTLDEVAAARPDKADRLLDLRAKWKERPNLTRSDVVWELEALSRDSPTKEQSEFVRWVDRGPATLAWHRDHALAGRANLLIGSEYRPLAGTLTLRRPEIVEKIDVQLPSLDFLLALDWRGLAAIRAEPAFEEAISALHGTTPSTWGESTVRYSRFLRTALMEAHKKAKIPDPVAFPTVTLYFSRGMTAGAGFLLGGALGQATGETGASAVAGLLAAFVRPEAERWIYRTLARTPAVPLRQDIQQILIEPEPIDFSKGWEHR